MRPGGRRRPDGWPVTPRSMVGRQRPPAATCSWRSHPWPCTTAARTRPDGGRDRRARRSRPAEVRGAVDAVQRRHRHGGPVVATARGMSLFGEHAARLARARPARCARSTGRAAATGSPRPPASPRHTARRSRVKRVVRRPRPADPRVQVLVGTPSRLSFPSAHATSTTAAAVLFGGLSAAGSRPRLVPADGAVPAGPGRALPDRRAAGALLGAGVAAADAPPVRKVRR